MKYSKQTSPSIDEINNIINIYKNKQYKEAHKLIDKLIIKFPKFGWSYKVKAALLTAENKHETSIAFSKKALFFIPSDAEIYFNIGIALKELGKYEESIQYYQKSITIKSDYADAFYNLAITYKEINELEKAINSYKNAIAIYPTFLDAYRNLTTIYLESGNFEEAHKYCMDVIRVDPKGQRAYNTLGYLMCCIDDIKVAIRVYEKSLELNLTEVDSYGAIVSLAVLYFLESRFDLSIKMLERPISFSIDYEIEYKGFKIYHGFLVKLLSSRDEMQKSCLEITSDEDILYSIGESHALALNGVRVCINDNELYGKAKWIQGCKQWHLANNKSNNFKRQLKIIIHKIPEKSNLLFAIGEIDTRPNEGIWQVYLKREKNLDEIIDNTVGGYIEFLYENLKDKHLSLVTIQGIPAPNYALVGDKDPGDIESFLNMIKQVNEKLKELTLEKGWNFLDVYSATVGEDGKSNKKWHIDGSHLLPLFYIQANNWLIKPKHIKQPQHINLSIPDLSLYPGMHVNLTKPDK